MGSILSSLNRTIIASIVLAVVVLIFAYVVVGIDVGGVGFWAFIFRWLHVISGVMWIGLLWYFNFVQIPTMPKIPAELKGGVSKFIAPEALFWFRWAAMSTLVTGLIVAALQNYLADALLLGTVNGSARMIGIGMWLAIIMWFNVWFVIWPNQKKVLGIVQVDADATAKAARTAMLFSRTNTMLSLPMLFCMVAQSHIA